MSRHAKTAGAVLSVSILAACGGGSGAPTLPPAVPNALSTASGGGAPEVTRAKVSRHTDGGIVLEMTEGPMDGMTLLCDDQGLRECSVVGGATGTAPKGRLATHLSGDYAFLGNFEVKIEDGSTATTTNQIVFSALPEQTDVTPRLPEGVVDYTGRFEGGFGLVNVDDGQLSGDATLLANFNSGRISGELFGQTQDGLAVAGNFNNLEIDPATQGFRSTDGSTMQFQQQQAWGDINGGFYGPNAEEAAGVFNIGNSAGGMSGMFLACEGAQGTCIRP